MPFKIVQTREPGRKMPSLSIVPSAWEKDGTLFWPPVKKKGLLPKVIRDGNSRPETDWVPQPCSKKRQTFLSYEAADMELTAMEQKSDSDVADDDKVTMLPVKRLTTRKRKEIGRVSQTDFNFLAEECQNRAEALFGTQTTKQTLNVQQENNNWSIENQSTCMPINKNYENVVPQYTIISKNGSRRILMPQDTKQQEHVDNLQTIMSVNQQSPLPSGSKQIKVVPSKIYLLDEKAESVCDANFPASQMDFEENEEFTYEIEQSNENGQIKLCIDNQNTIVQNQSMLLENQMRIIQQLANQEAMLQLLCQHMSNTTITASTSQTSDKPSCSNDSTHDPLPIDSLVKLEQLEMALSDETYMKQLIINKSQICGTNGKMNGLNCCYHLIDCFFKRQFLMQFSWSGGSRRDEGKMPFKIYKNVMKTFYKIVSKADSQFAENEGEIFFKGVIKNAKRRSELEAISIEKRRVSSGKKRPKNLTYRTVKENETQSDEEIDTADAGGDTEGTEENEKAEETEEARLSESAYRE